MIVSYLKISVNVIKGEKLYPSTLFLNKISMITEILDENGKFKLTQIYLDNSANVEVKERQSDILKLVDEAYSINIDNFAICYS